MNQKFCNTWATWDTIRQLQMLLPWLWKWRTTLDCAMPNSPVNLRVLLIRYASMASESTFFRPTRPCLIVKVLATRAKFLESSGYCTVINYAFTFRTTNIFGSSYGVIAPFKFVEHKFFMLHVHLWSFQITHRMKQCLTYQHNNYNDTANHSGYLS